MVNLGSIHTYHSEVDQIIRYGGSYNETSIRRAFHGLINAYARPRDLLLVEELSYYNPQRKKTVTPDGTLKNSLRLDYGFWESKDTSDDLDVEIAKKFAKGYPDSNILFEDSRTAILYQDGQRMFSTPFDNNEALDELLTAYVSFEHPEVREFKQAVERFKQDIPSIVKTLREMIDAQSTANAPFRKRRDTFLELCRTAINPAVTPADVDEMLIQHILTEEIFLSIFSDTQLLDENNIARELKEVEATFFTGQTKRDTLGHIKHYYECIKAQATSIVSPKEKQTFLKVIYENFYKAYNPKGADRLGIVYTPGEIVDFMIRSTDTLLHRHFGKGLADKGVDILDPATGTGTYICEIIEYLPRNVLARKYKDELHANEVAILPYYIANLNIETAYNAKMGSYVPFDNICFVDTLDNTEGLNVENQFELGGLSQENTRRIKEQNKKKISVIIGNPPYNANQQNENDNNKNRTYAHIDKRIKATYIDASTAQKTKVYDMYARFIRWASDRLADQGIVAFICNRSFVDARTYDGFRKTVAQEFDHIYIVDTKSDVRANPKISRTKHNIFGIQAGVAIVFFVKDRRGTAPQSCRISYTFMADEVTRENKLEILSAAKIETLEMENVQPDADGNWLQMDVSDFKSLLPLVGEPEQAIFGFSCNAIKSNRDEWVYDAEQSVLAKKSKFFGDEYNRLMKAADFTFHVTLKWSADLKTKFEQGRKSKFDRKWIVPSLFRPFTQLFFYSEKMFVDRLTEYHYQMFGPELGNENIVIAVHSVAASFRLSALAANMPFDYGFIKQGNGGTFGFALYRYDSEGTRHDNLTDWGLKQFQTHYGDPKITKLDIFHYTYAVLHHPAYRATYEINLKREFPRLPYYADFRQWVRWGKALMDLHLNYEQAAPFAFERMDRKEPVSKQADLLPDEPLRPAKHLFDDKPHLKPKLRLIRETGGIEIDATTTLNGIPSIAWAYKLGNRSGLEWVLDQWKEHKISDPTIAEKFNTYRFADHKEAVIALLARVCTVSMETMKIVQAMP
ncbi:MAG: adenine specific methyltransferase [Verrucomicrobiaceae bacterium]|nr:adenine specific methyltransferase [Verrucomicrobiaceae bacterium]